MYSVHFKRDGENVVAIIQKDEDGVKEESPFSDVSDVQPYYFEGEERPVLVTTVIGGGSYSYKYYVSVHEIIDDKVIMHTGMFCYCFEFLPYDSPLILDKVELKCLKKLVSEKEE